MNEQSIVPSSEDQKRKELSTGKTSKMGHGYASNISQEDLILPRVELMQFMSPTVKEGKATAGELRNNITKAPLTSNIIIPISVKKNFIRWRPRDEGGGIMWQTDDHRDERVIEETEWKDDNKPLATSYLNFLCIVQGDSMPIVVSFCKTSYKAGRQLLTMTKLFGGPDSDISMRRYKLGSKLVQDPKTSDYYIFTVEDAGPASKEEMLTSRAFCEAFGPHKYRFEEEGDEPTDNPKPEKSVELE